MKALVFVDDLKSGSEGEMLPEWLKHRGRDLLDPRVVVLFQLGEREAALKESGAKIEFLQMKNFWDIQAFGRVRKIIRTYRPDAAACVGPASRALFPWFMDRYDVPIVMYWERIKQDFFQNLLERIQLHYATGFQSCSGTLAKALSRKYWLSDIDVIKSAKDWEFSLAKNLLKISMLRREYDLKKNKRRACKV